MNPSKRRVEGFDFLYIRGRSYEVRVQVPRPLRTSVGKWELKKSLGGDFSKARRLYHRTVADLQARIDAAKRSTLSPSPLVHSGDNAPTRDEIDAASYTHFKRMVERLRGKAISPTGIEGTSRIERQEAFRFMIENQIDAGEAEAWSTMSAQAEWLCQERGWTLDPASPNFEYLCQTMLRARIQAYRNELRRLEGHFSNDPNSDPLFGSTPPKPSKRPKTLGDLVEKFKVARSLNWSGSTEKNYIIIFRVIEEICGKETPLAEIDHDFCIGVRNRLLDVPANYQKRPATRGKSLVEAMQIAVAEGIPTISRSTVNSHLNKLGAIVRFGRDQGWIVGNPMAGIEVDDPVAPEEKRDPFTIDQLNQIFACSPWSGEVKGGGDRPSRYWAPLISMFSGARLTEICGQRVDEMIVEIGVRAFNFRHRPGDREIKNGKSRKVPVHPELIRLGFWDFVEDARKSGREMLFPDVSRDRLGKWGDGTSKWFSRLIDRLVLIATEI